MKDFKKPPFKQKAIALGFTFGVHVIAVVGLLYLGMSKPPEPPKQIRTVLIKPEDLKPVTLEETEFTETAHENVAKEITQTAPPAVEPAPVIPTAPPIAPVVPKVDAQKAAADAKAAEAAARKAELQQQIQARAKAEAEALAIRDMMNAPARVLKAAKPPEEEKKGTLHKPVKAEGADDKKKDKVKPGAKTIKSTESSSTWNEDGKKRAGGLKTRGDTTGGSGNWRTGGGRRKNQQRNWYHAQLCAKRCGQWFSEPLWTAKEFLQPWRYKNQPTCSQ